jgi:hypothetical protein
MVPGYGMSRGATIGGGIGTGCGPGDCARRPTAIPVRVHVRMKSAAEREDVMAGALEFYAFRYAIYG